MRGGGGGGAGAAAESAATWTAVVRLISSFRSFQEATLPVAKPSAHALNRAPIEAISLQEQLCTTNYTACAGLRSSLDHVVKAIDILGHTGLWLGMRLSMSTGS